MTAATDTDIQQIKDLITAGSAATQKQIADLREEMRIGFANVDTKFAKLEGKIDNLDGRLVAVESINKTIDGRLWSLIATLLGLTVTALLGIFVRYLFSHDSIL